MRLPSKSSPGSARGSDPVARINARLPTSSAPVEPAGDGPPVHDRARPGDHGDVATLQQRLEATGQPVDDLLLAGLAGAQVERRLARVDAVRLGARHGAQHLGGLEQLLRRDAARCRHVPPTRWSSTRAMLRPGRGAVERGGIATGAAPEDDDVEAVGHSRTFR